jgi:hypothetical protein
MNIKKYNKNKNKKIKKKFKTLHIFHKKPIVLYSQEHSKKVHCNLVK